MVNHEVVGAKLAQIFKLIAEVIAVVGFEDRAVNGSLLGLEVCFNILREYLDKQFQKEDNYDVRVYYPKER